MDEIERQDTVGEVVTPTEQPEERRGQTSEENHRFQAARRSGERAGFERAMRQIRTEQELERSEQDRTEEFIERDLEQFMEVYPEVDVAELDADRYFRRFCGSRYGREPLSELYADYLEIAGGQRAAGALRAESRSRRQTGTGSGSGGETLSARQQEELDEWNRTYPGMKMSAKEFLSR